MVLVLVVVGGNEATKQQAGIERENTLEYGGSSAALVLVVENRNRVE